MRGLLLVLVLVLAGCAPVLDVGLVAPEEIAVPWAGCAYDPGTGLLEDPACELPDPLVVALDLALLQEDGGVGLGEITITSAWTDIAVMPPQQIEDVAASLLNATEPTSYTGDDPPDYSPTFGRFGVEDDGTARVFLWVWEMPRNASGAALPSTLMVSGGTDAVQIRVVPE